MERIIKTLFVVLIYCIVWILLETILYGQAEYRTVDDIMIVLFAPMIFKAIDKPKGEK